MEQAQINVRTRACSRTFIARTKQAALTHNVRGKRLKNRMPVIPFASERVFNSATFMPTLIPLKTLRNVSNLHLKIYSG